MSLSIKSNQKTWLGIPEEYEDQVKEEVDKVFAENKELKDIVNLYTGIIKYLGEEIKNITDENLHLDRLLQIEEGKNFRQQ